MVLKNIIRAAVLAASSALLPPVFAADTVQTFSWGVPDLSCTSESMGCGPDPAYAAFNGGYRAGGAVSWSWDFDRSSFGAITSLALDVAVIGMWQNYPGNIDPQLGQLGNYLAIDGVPFAPFLDLTDGRDTRSFLLPTSLADGAHMFSVVAYGYHPGPKLEGWGGVDSAQVTVVASAVPEPGTSLLMTAGLGMLAFLSRRRRPR